MPQRLIEPPVDTSGPSDRERDGTGTWSLTTLQRAVRRRPGLERISRDTISTVLHDAGLTWQRDRTWCDTGVSIRQVKQGTRVVIDVDAAYTGRKKVD